jgi:NTP pyrophosphatase (non-canonical NTP hydrolase)
VEKGGIKMNKEFDAVKIIGIPALLEQTAEEASELAQACLKMSRELRGENPTPKNMIQIRNELLEEIADVMNCIEQLVEQSQMIGHEAVDSMRIHKMERWEQRLCTVDVGDIPDFLNKTMNIHHPAGKLPEPVKERKVKDIQYTHDIMTNTIKKKVVYEDGGIEYE